MSQAPLRKTSRLVPFTISALMAAMLTACGGSSGGSIAPSSSSSSEESSSSSESASSEESSSSSSSSSSEESSSSSSSSSSSEDGSSAFFSIEPDFQLYTLAEFPVGVAVSAGNEPYSIFSHGDAVQRQDLVTEHFNELTAGNIMKMSYLQPSEGNFSFTDGGGDANEMVGFAAINGMTVHGHSLVWHSDYQVPNFMRDYDGDFAEMLATHVTEIVNYFEEEYPGTVISWDVVNEAITDNPGQDENGWRRSLFYNELPPASESDIPEYIRQSFQAARDTGADIDLYYNDYDNTANSFRLNKTLEIADALAEDGLIDGVGFQMHVYMDYPSLSDFENAFEEVVERGLKVKITELDVAVVNPYGAGEPPAQPDYDEELAGAQKQRFCDIARVYLETVPAEFRGGFTVWGLTDDESWLMNQFSNAAGADYDDVWPLLFNGDLSAKPALQGVADAFQGNACNSDI